MSVNGKIPVLVDRRTQRRRQTGVNLQAKSTAEGVAFRRLLAMLDRDATVPDANAFERSGRERDSRILRTLPLIRGRGSRPILNIVTRSV